MHAKLLFMALLAGRLVAAQLVPDLSEVDVVGEDDSYTMGDYLTFPEDEDDGTDLDVYKRGLNPISGLPVPGTGQHKHKHRKGKGNGGSGHGHKKHPHKSHRGGAKKPGQHPRKHGSGHSGRNRPGHRHGKNKPHIQFHPHGGPEHQPVKTFTGHPTQEKPPPTPQTPHEGHPNHPEGFIGARGV